MYRLNPLTGRFVDMQTGVEMPYGYALQPGEVLFVGSQALAPVGEYIPPPRLSPMQRPMQLPSIQEHRTLSPLNGNGNSPLSPVSPITPGGTPLTPQQIQQQQRLEDLKRSQYQKK